LLLTNEFGLLEIQGHSEAMGSRRPKRTIPCPGFSMDRLRKDIEDLNGYTLSRSRPGAKERNKDDRQLYSPNDGAGPSGMGLDKDTLPAAPPLSEQNKIILEYLHQPGRTLTNLIALTNLGIGSLTSRISELRQMGHEIVSEPATDFHGRRYIKYSLKQPKPETP
jgi:hypothetical protein